MRRREMNRKKSVRFLMVIIIFAVILSACMFFQAGKVFAKNRYSDEKRNMKIEKLYKSIEIKKGDTLWSIADKYQDSQFSSKKEYIKEIRQINGLYHDCLQEHQYLTVVYYDSID